MPDLPIVLILGHSFITRFHYLVNNPRHADFPDNLDLAECRVKYYGIGGMKIKDLYSEQVLGAIQLHRPSVVILQTGGNDLSSTSHQAISLASSLVDFAIMLRDVYGVRAVVINEAFWRFKAWTKRPSRRQRLFDADIYARRRKEFNNFLEHVLEQEPNIRMWYHTRFVLSAPSVCFLPDGVHLSKIGNRRFYRMLRAAAVTGVHMLRPSSPMLVTSA